MQFLAHSRTPKILSGDLRGRLLQSCVRGGSVVSQNLQAKRFYVTGMVQGVGYRFFAQRVADRLGVAGYAKNLRGGDVEVYAIGTPEQFRALKAELERGPRAASVSYVSEEDAEVEPRYAGSFIIERDWW
jgi:acylphosphatase